MMHSTQPASTTTTNKTMISSARSKKNKVHSDSNSCKYNSRTWHKSSRCRL